MQAVETIRMCIHHYQVICISNNSLRHLISVPPGRLLLSDVLISSPILSEDRSSSIPAELGGTGDIGTGTSSGGNQFEFGVDPSLDPELAMVSIFLPVYSRADTV